MQNRNDVLSFFRNSKVVVSRESGLLYIHKKTKTHYFIRDRDDRCFMKSQGQFDFVEYVGGREFLESDEYTSIGAKATIRTLEAAPCN